MSKQSESQTGRAEAEMGALRFSVQIDGKWCPDVRWYTQDLPVFIAEDGTEIDILDDGGIRYETPGGAVEEIVEPDSEEEAVQVYKPMPVYPADRIEVWDVNRRPVRTESADFGAGKSTGVQEL